MGDTADFKKKKTSKWTERDQDKSANTAALKAAK